MHRTTPNVSVWGTRKVTVHNVDDECDEVKVLSNSSHGGSAGATRAAPRNLDNNKPPQTDNTDVNVGSSGRGPKARRPKNTNRLGLAVESNTKSHQTPRTEAVASSRVSTAKPSSASDGPSNSSSAIVSGRGASAWSQGKIADEATRPESLRINYEGLCATSPSPSSPETPQAQQSSSGASAPPPKNAETMRLGGYYNPHSLPMKYIIGDLNSIRPELRHKYSAKDSISALIPNGDRTATTRRPPPGVKVGDYVVFFPAVEGLYVVVDFVKVDLTTPEGVETWSKREGWSVEAAFQHGPQVSTGRTQMLYKRVA